MQIEFDSISDVCLFKFNKILLRFIKISFNKISSILISPNFQKGPTYTSVCEEFGTKQIFVLDLSKRRFVV